MHYGMHVGVLGQDYVLRIDTLISQGKGQQIARLAQRMRRKQPLFCGDMSLNFETQRRGLFEDTVAGQRWAPRFERTGTNSLAAGITYRSIERGRPCAELPASVF